jgi:hypothetical protein
MHNLNHLIADFLKKPVNTESVKPKRLLCRCGNLCSHNARWCKSCGGEFIIDPRGVTHGQIIQMWRNKPKWKFDDTIRYLYGIWHRSYFPNATFEDFKEAVADYDKSLPN